MDSSFDLAHANSILSPCHHFSDIFRENRGGRALEGGKREISRRQKRLSKVEDGVGKRLVGRSRRWRVWKGGWLRVRTGEGGKECRKAERAFPQRYVWRVTNHWRRPEALKYERTRKRVRGN